MRRRQQQTTVPGADPGPFVLEVWLGLVPTRHPGADEWATAEQRHRHRCARAYLLWLAARRRQGVT